MTIWKRIGQAIERFILTVLIVGGLTVALISSLPGVKEPSGPGNPPPPELPPSIQGVIAVLLITSTVVDTDLVGLFHRNLPLLL